MTTALSPEAKYGKDAPFNDPVVRCDSCRNLIFTDTLRKDGHCNHCGNRKVREVRFLDQHEMDVLKARNVDPDFLAMFQAKDGAE